MKKDISKRERDRLERERYAKSLYRQHEDYGRRRINELVRAKYGKGLSHARANQLRYEVYKPTDTDRRRQALLDEGFARFEANLYSKRDINSPGMRAIRAERRELVSEWEREGLTKRAYRGQIVQHYIENDYLIPGKRGGRPKLDPFLPYVEKVRELKAPIPKPAVTPKPERERLKLVHGIPFPELEVPKGDFQKRSELLIQAGFHRELEVLPYMTALAVDGSPQSIDLTTGVWKDAIQERQRLIRRCHKLGMSDRAIDKMIENFYHQDPYRSPWIWIRKEYNPPPQTKAYTSLFERSKERRQQATRETKPLYDYIAKLEARKSRLAKIKKKRGKQ